MQPNLINLLTSHFFEKFEARSRNWNCLEFEKHGDGTPSNSGTTYGWSRHVLQYLPTLFAVNTLGVRGKRRR